MKNFSKLISVMCAVVLCFAGTAVAAEANADLSQETIPAVTGEMQEQSFPAEETEFGTQVITDLSAEEICAGEPDAETADPAAEDTEAADPAVEEAENTGSEVADSEEQETTEPLAEEADPAEAPEAAEQEPEEPEFTEFVTLEMEVIEPAEEVLIIVEPEPETTEAISVETIIEDQTTFETEVVLTPVLEEIIITDQPEEEYVEESLNVTEDKNKLSYGMYSTAVGQLQQALRNKGYDILADDYFGHDTELIVKMFQMYNGMSVTGIADANVINAANGSGAGYFSLGKGADSYLVAMLQTMLRNSGYLQSYVDGSYGSYTEGAVRLYQEKNGLYVDGVVGPQTWRSILNSSISSNVVKKADVFKLQTRLDQLGFLQSDIDGDYGAFTKRAVKEFQMFNGLSVTGTVDTATSTALNSTSANTYYELSYGSTGSSVQAVQGLLRNLGYISFSPDGQFGTVTRLAVAKFQAMNNLTVDGKVGIDTVNKLVLNALAYDPSVFHVTGQAEQLASSTLDQLGWDLYKAYRWSADFPHSHAYTGLTLSTAAVYGFKYGTGDCTAKASTFCMMARALGFDCKVISGYVPLSNGSYNDHAWCEFYYNGRTYICDPSFENGTGRNGYMIYYGQSGTWRYIYGNILEE